MKDAGAAKTGRYVLEQHIGKFFLFTAVIQTEDPFFYMVAVIAVLNSADMDIPDLVRVNPEAIAFDEGVVAACDLRFTPEEELSEALAGIREKLRYSDVPDGLQGLGITFIIVGLMSLGFMGLSGIQL